MMIDVMQNAGLCLLATLPEVKNSNVGGTHDAVLYRKTLEFGIQLVTINVNTSFMATISNIFPDSVSIKGGCCSLLGCQ